MQDIKNFLDGEGRLTAFPAKRRMRIRALLYLAGKFAPGRVYTEKEVNQLLNAWHTFGDPATLRRELFDWKLIGRENSGKSYWLEEVLPTAEELEQKNC